MKSNVLPAIILILLGGGSAFQHEISDLRGNTGVADTQAQAREVLVVAEGGDDIAQAIVAAVAAALLKACDAGGEIQFVVGD